MNPPAWLQSSLELCDSETAVAALNALADGLFLIDLATGTGRPINSAALGMIADLDGDSSVELPLARCFPDLDFSADRGIEAASHLTHLCSDKSGTPCDVHVQFRRLAVGNQQANSNSLLLAIVRRLEVKAPADGLSPRDAFDDAFHDPLTRLPNRRLFARRLERAVRRGADSQYHFAVLFVDLDRFKVVNDQFGHLLGDRLLISAAHRLVEAVRPQDMVARRDGDEFTILLDDLEQPDDAVRVAERIVEHLDAPFLVDGPKGPLEVTIGASIGVALPSDRTSTADDLIAQADAAMYHAKALGGGTFATLGGPNGKPRPR